MVAKWRLMVQHLRQSECMELHMLKKELLALKHYLQCTRIPRAGPRIGPASNDLSLSSGFDAMVMLGLVSLK